MQSPFDIFYSEKITIHEHEVTHCYIVLVIKATYIILVLLEDRSELTLIGVSRIVEEIAVIWSTEYAIFVVL